MTDVIVDDDGCGVATLLRYVPEGRHKEFLAYVKKVIDEDEGCSFDGTFLGFIEDYINYAGLLKRKANVHNDGPPWWNKTKQPPLTVYDVGCCLALQHLVFDSRIHYVGIERSKRVPEPKFFRDNCKFVRGGFKDVVGELNVHYDTSIGISNMSLLYDQPDPEEQALFDKTFRFKFVL
jgi:hypothetical protein